MRCFELLSLGQGLSPKIVVLAALNLKHPNNRLGSVCPFSLVIGDFSEKHCLEAFLHTIKNLQYISQITLPTNYLKILKNYTMKSKRL